MNAKLLIGSALAIAALTVGVGPLVIGQQTEKNLRAQHQAYNAMLKSSGWIQVSLEDYQRNWGSASAKTIVTLNLQQLASMTDMLPEDQQGLPENVQISFDHQIIHGPLVTRPTLKLALAQVQTTLDIPGQYQQIIRHYFAEQPPFQQNTVIGLTGNAEAEFSIPSFTGLAHDDVTTVDWQGLTGTSQGDLINMVGTTTLTAPRLVIEDNGNRLSLLDAKAEGHSRGIQYGTMIGDSAISMGEISINTEGENRGALKQLAVAMSIRQQNGLLSASEDIRFDSLTINELAMGPARLDLALRNLHGETVQKMQEQFNELLYNPPQNPELAQQQIASIFISQVPELLKHSPALEISKGHLTTHLGDIDSRLLITFDGSQPIDLQGAPFTLISHLGLELDVAMPTRLTQLLARNQAQGKLDMMLANASEDQLPSEQEYQQMLEQSAQQVIEQLEMGNVLLREGDRHKTSLRFNGKQLEMNGQQADQLLGMLPR